MNLPPVIISVSDRDRLAATAVEAMCRPQTPPVAATLLSELARARIVADKEFPRSAVRMHSRVEIRDDINKRLSCVTLVFPEEQENTENGRISVLTPLGTALIGLSEGASMSWSTATGYRSSITVLRIVRS
jgi:regulator of nucleoside diphosphate kinase